jgi:hypothetical protein
LSKVQATIDGSGGGSNYDLQNKMKAALDNAKTPEEAMRIARLISDNSSDGRVNGFHKEKDDNGNMLVDKDSQADKLLKGLGITPTYYDEYDGEDFAT